jgi:hypothetical protein
MYGLTGNIEFNEEGDRIESLYEIINIQQGHLKAVGTYRTNTVCLKSKGDFVLLICFFFRVHVIQVQCVDKS